MKNTISWLLKWRLTRATLVYLGERGPMLADSITYRALFSVFAGVLLGFSAAAIWLGGNPEAMHALAESVSQVIPGMKEFLDADQMKVPIGFTVTGIVSLFGLIAAAIGAINSLRIALHVLAEEDLEDISAVSRYTRYLVVAVGVGLLLGVASLGTFATSIGIGTISQWLGLGADSNAVNLMGRLAGVLVVYAFDVVAVAVTFKLLSGTRAGWPLIWKGSAIGGVGLVVLQEFSGLFVKSATDNPLLASFGSLVALLLWFNLSSQVILIASSWIIVAVQEGHLDGIDWGSAKTIEEWQAMRTEQLLDMNEARLRKEETGSPAGG